MGTCCWTLKVCRRKVCLIQVIVSPTCRLRLAVCKPDAVSLKKVCLKQMVPSKANSIHTAAFWHCRTKLCEQWQTTELSAIELHEIPL